jgi:hypothetical protein
MSDESRIPLWVAGRPVRVGRSRLALILTSNSVAPAGYVLVRHADAAAVAQAGGCQCCRVPSSLATLLRQLFLDRVRGEVDFDGVAVEASQALVEQAMADLLVAARYEFRGSISPSDISKRRPA